MKTGSLALLFRRRYGPKPPKHFVACFVADACEDAVEAFQKSKLPTIGHLSVSHGPEQDSVAGVPVGKPSYHWVRVETMAIGENLKIPARLRRGANGLLKPRNI